ncbi:MAG: PmoA family protein [Gemmataceae bacterium]|nr:PmoA family protein [Gemmataceae bacterium]
MIPNIFQLVYLFAGFASDPAELAAAKTANGLEITLNGKPLATFSQGDNTILRPYFSNLHSPKGMRLTRTHPPLSDRDATDHATMHPGLWLGFGDISGEDFWRNKARMEPKDLEIGAGLNSQPIRFATRHALNAAGGRLMGHLKSRFSVRVSPIGCLIVWDAALEAGEKGLVLGDQEEMGFGARMAGPLIEKKGGKIANSKGKTTAKDTWGQPAEWTDYSGIVNGAEAGITLFASPDNLRPSWWHNRDYGLMVANPFGRQAMRQGTVSQMTVHPGGELRLTFGAILHDSKEYAPERAYAEFLEAVQPKSRKIEK